MPWQSKPLYPIKHLPIYYPPQPWQVIPLASDPNFPVPKPPAGLPIPWWLLPKGQWPYQTPFETKVFGALPAMQTMMAENYSHHFPPLGVWKFRMPGQAANERYQISFQNLKIHTRRLDFDQMKVKAHETPFGVRYYFKGKAWDKYKNSDKFVSVEPVAPPEPDQQAANHDPFT